MPESYDPSQASSMLSERWRSIDSCGIEANVTVEYDLEDAKRIVNGLRKRSIQDNRTAYALLGVQLVAKLAEQIEKSRGRAA